MNFLNCFLKQYINSCSWYPPLADIYYGLSAKSDPQNADHLSNNIDDSTLKYVTANTIDSSYNRKYTDKINMVPVTYNWPQ